MRRKLTPHVSVNAKTHKHCIRKRHGAILLVRVCARLAPLARTSQLATTIHRAHCEVARLVLNVCVYLFRCANSNELRGTENECCICIQN